MGISEHAQHRLWHTVGSQQMFAESAYKQGYSRNVTEEMKWRRADVGDQQSKEGKDRSEVNMAEGLTRET